MARSSTTFRPKWRMGCTTVIRVPEEHVVLVERGDSIAAVWYTIRGGQARWLAHQVLNFQRPREEGKGVLRREAATQRERAFAVMLGKRVQRGGIMGEGAGLVKTG